MQCDTTSAPHQYNCSQRQTNCVGSALILRRIINHAHFWWRSQYTHRTQAVCPGTLNAWQCFINRRTDSMTLIICIAWHDKEDRHNWQTYRQQHKAVVISCVHERFQWMGQVFCEHWTEQISLLSRDWTPLTVLRSAEWRYRRIYYYQSSHGEYLQLNDEHKKSLTKGKTTRQQLQSSSTQVTLTAFGERPVSFVSQQQRDKLALDYILGDLQPLGKVEKPSFIKSVTG